MEKKANIEIVCDSYDRLRELEFYLFNYKYFEEITIKVSFKKNKNEFWYKTEKHTENGQDFYVIVTDDMKLE